MGDPGVARLKHAKDRPSWAVLQLLAHSQSSIAESLIWMSRCERLRTTSEGTLPTCYCWLGKSIRRYAKPQDADPQVFRILFRILPDKSRSCDLVAVDGGVTKESVKQEDV